LRCPLKCYNFFGHSFRFRESVLASPSRIRGLAECFADDAVVHDEGQHYRGKEAIRQWKKAADAKYNYVSEPLTASTEGDRVKVRAKLTGDFPGSPAELIHVFQLANNKIQFGDSFMNYPFQYQLTNSRISGSWLSEGRKGWEHRLCDGSRWRELPSRPQHDRLSRKTNNRRSSFQADIGAATGAQEIVNDIQEKWGGIDILVNSVGARKHQVAVFRLSPTMIGRGR